MRTKLRAVWRSMHERCTYPSHKDWHNYGGRGIKVCRRWRIFKHFAADMGPYPGNRLTLDRKRNARNYCKSNCRWASQKMQQRNKRTNKLTAKLAAQIRIDVGSSRALGRKYGVDQKMILGIKNGTYWS